MEGGINLLKDGMALGLAGLFVLSLFTGISVMTEVAAEDDDYTPEYNILVASYTYSSYSGWVKEFTPDGSATTILTEDSNLPTYARRTADGNTLITVCHGEDQRVVELDPDGDTVWEYSDGLNGPYHSERLGNGNTLIADHYNCRVIEVTTDGDIEWQITGESGMLYYPLDAERLEDGNTLIVDSYHDRVIEVDSEKEIVWETPGYMTGQDNLVWNPFDADRSPDGDTLITSYYYGGVKEFDEDFNEVWSWGNNDHSYSWDAGYLENGNILVACSNTVYEVNRDDGVVWSLDVDDTVLSVDAVYTNDPPVADAGSDLSDYLGTAFSFDGTGSSDPDGTIFSYDWDFGDGSAHGSGSSPSHEYADHGTYIVTLEVTDDDGATDTDTLTVTILNNPPVASIAGGDRTLITNELATFDGSGSEDPDGTIDSYEWDWGDSTAAGTTETADHSWSVAGKYTVTLTVTDDDGASDDASVTVTVVKATAAIDDTIDLVESLDLPTKVEEKLLDPLQDAMDKLDDGNWAGAEKKLGKYIDRVMDQYEDGKLTEEQAGQLTAAAEWIIDSVNEVIDGCIADTEDAIALVEGMGLDSKVEDALVEKLDDAIAKLEDGKLDGARDKLEAFIDKVTAKHDKGKLTDEQADQLIAAAEAIIAQIP